MELVNIGYGSMISAGRLIAVVSPDSAPIKRIIQDARDRGTLIDATCGRRTRAVLIMDSEHVILSAVQPETVAHRLDSKDALTLEEEAVTSAHAKSMGGSQVFLEEGEKQTVETLIKCIVVASGNDASVVMAEHIAGSEEEFVKRMNQKAKELGLDAIHDTVHEMAKDEARHGRGMQGLLDRYFK